MAETQAITRNRMISELSRSTHGKLEEYVACTRLAVLNDPEFLAHLIAWNQVKGQVRDSKVALPVCSLTSDLPKEFAENSLAHLAMQGPRELVRAWRFSKTVGVPGYGGQLRQVIQRWLRVREENWAWFQRVAIQHRATLRELYALTHTKPGTVAQGVLFEGRKLGVFQVLADLPRMSDVEAAGQIVEHKIPFLIAQGALGKRIGQPDLLLALMDRMTPTEVVTNTKMLVRFGVEKVPALRAAMQEKLEAIGKSGKQALKTGKAISGLAEGKLKEQLRGAQDKQLQAMGIDGNWLVLGDKSGSMAGAIEVARVVAATLAKAVRGEVKLVFFDTSPRTYDVTGKDYDQVLAVTRHVQAGGGTSIGCGLAWAREVHFEFDGICVISDGAEHSAPRFVDQYQRLVLERGVEVPVYFYQTRGEPDGLSSGMAAAGLEVQRFDLTAGDVDYHSLPNLIQTMRVRRYSLVDEILECGLVELDQVFQTRREEGVVVG